MPLNPGEARAPAPATAPSSGALDPTARRASATETPPGQGVDDLQSDPPTRVPLKIEDWLTVIVMALLALITFANVITRYFTNQAFAWTEEFSIFLMIVLAMVAGSAAVARDRHIRIELLAERGSARRRQVLAVLAAGLTFLTFAVLAVLSTRLVWDDFQYEETSPALGLPQWWYSAWFPLLAAAIAARALGLMCRRLRRPPASGEDAGHAHPGAQA
ncbi:MAG: C4-dicarboxylate TRAP transporter small permease protein DctQ [Paracidovorax wautersii]|uniref:TRAP transporter small permease protein n=1 Tax=Paracidovorax wautersii TaxID=1177982 RepID=A0A7V8FRD3_9BURK|nr:MAG: C4-dicarboxylate TRAP transporter small permease protein DctQ [Paracidovorax wautersii]